MGKSDWDKQKIEIIESAIIQDSKDELLDNITIRVPPSRKYKKESKNEKNLPDLTVGKKIVVRMNKINKSRNDEVLGYMMCQLLDWDTWEPRWQGFRTNMISQVLKVSHPDLVHMVGRLVTGRYSESKSYFYGNPYEVCSFDKNFVKWI